MKAIVLRHLGGPEVLNLEEVADPAAGPGEAVVRLRAAALNHRDVWIRQGRYSGITLPVILGSDGAGDVESVGEGVDRGWIGKPVVLYPVLDWGPDPRVQAPTFRILGLPDDGTYAQKVKVPVELLYPKPTHLTYEEAAAFPLCALTAYRAVVTRGEVHAGENVVIIGIGGGVATFAMQIALERGATVYVTTGDDEKIQRARSLGARDGVNYRTRDWVKELKNIPGGIDVIIDGTGGETLDAALDLLKPGGRLVNYGQTLGPAKELQVRRIFWKQLTILGSTMGTKNEFEAVVQLYERQRLKPVVDSIFPLADTAAAHRRMEEAKQFGKIVLKID
jgi:zinc-binding alcohol dehydrogenase/oxidoreductase